MTNQIGIKTDNNLKVSSSCVPLAITKEFEKLSVATIVHPKLTFIVDSGSFSFNRYQCIKRQYHKSFYWCFWIDIWKTFGGGTNILHPLPFYASQFRFSSLILLQLIQHGFKLANENKPKTYFESIVGPTSKLHFTVLVIKWEPGDINRT